MRSPFKNVLTSTFLSLFSILLMISASSWAIANEKSPDSPKHKDTKKAQKLVLPEMVNIPAGSFMMGNINNFESKEGRTWTDWEQPVHKVDIKAFRMGKYEITWEQYDVFAVATGRPKPDDGDAAAGPVATSDALMHISGI